MGRYVKSRNYRQGYRELLLSKETQRREGSLKV